MRWRTMFSTFVCQWRIILINHFLYLRVPFASQRKFLDVQIGFKLRREFAVLNAPSVDPLPRLLRTRSVRLARPRPPRLLYARRSGRALGPSECPRYDARVRRKRANGTATASQRKQR